MNMQAKKALQHARSILMIDHPFFGCLVMHMKLVEHEGVETMGVDGTHLFYNPKFTLSLSEVHRVGVLAHEAYHCAYRHHTRMGTRRLDDWNRAGDYVINLDLKKAKFQLPDWVLYDEQYIGLSTEEVYAILDHKKQQQQKQQQKQQQQNQQGQQQSGNGQPQPSQNGNQPDKGKPGQKPGQGGKQQGKGADQQSGQPQTGQGGQQPSSGGGQGQIECPDPGRMGGVMPAVPAFDQSAMAAEEAKWEQITRQAVAVARAAGAGHVPGFLERLVQDLDKPKIDWKTVTRNFIDDSVSKNYSWLRPNKRYLHTGLIVPGLVSDDLHHIISVMDTSGSVTDDLVKEYAAEKTAVLDEGVTDKLTVIYSDTKVQGVDVFERGDEVKLRPKGGGGTKFRDVFNRIIDGEFGDPPSVILFFTDLETLDFGEDPGYPVLWVVHGDPRRAKRYADKVPFGEVVYAGM